MSLQQWLTSYDQIDKEVIDKRHYLHQHPELSFQEKDTKAYIVKELQSYGYQQIDTSTGGVVVTIGGKNPGKTLALRADFDALPIQEETDLPYASKNPNVMHACGHDAHTAALLAVAKVMADYQDSLQGKLLLVFQHAEEVLPGGAKDIVASGLLDDVDVMFGIHVRGDRPFDGKMEYCSGYAMAAADFFEVEVQGKGGHGASPHQTVDATVTTAFIVQQLQTLISRNKDPLKSGVITTAVFKSKTLTANIISDSAYLKGTVRTFDPDLRDLIERRMSEVVDGVCQAHGATGKVKYTRGYPSLYNHPKETDLLKTLFKDQISATPARMGGEDFSYYLEKFAGSFFFVNAGYHSGYNYPHHHPKFAVDDRCIKVSAEAFLTLIHYYLVEGKVA